MIRRVAPVVLLAACTSAVPADTSDTGDTAGLDARVLHFVGSYAGFDFSRATMRLVRRDDGGEIIEGTTVLDFTGFATVRLAVTDRVELDPDGRVETWDQQLHHELGDTALDYRIELDADSMRYDLTVLDHGGTGTWQGAGSPVLHAMPSDAFYALSLPTPVLGTVAARALATDDGMTGVLPLYRYAADVAPQTLPECGPLFGETFCWDEEGVVTSFTPSAYGVAVSRTEADPEVAPVAVPRATTWLEAPDCPVPSGDRHRAFAVSSADGTEIAGRLLLPEGEGPFPTVTINAGTGGNTRDGVISGTPHWDCLASGWLARGLAVVSYDDRGHGESGGGVSDSFHGRTGDAEAVATWTADQPEVGSLWLLGHSEGVAHVAAAAANVSGEAGVILVSGIAGTGAEAWIEQGVFYMEEVGLPADEVTAIREAREDVVAQVGAGTFGQDDLGGMPVEGFWDGFFALDGGELALETEGPVLVVQGGMDWQVPAHNGTDFEEILSASGRDVTLLAYPELGHLLQPALGGLAVGAEYWLPWTWHEDVRADVADWIWEREGAP